MQFLLRNFPKFKDEHCYDEYSSWEESLQNNGYPSAVSLNGLLYEMDDYEYTHFVLRWS